MPLNPQVGAGRIAILIPDYSVTKSVSTINTAILLAEAGYEVEILTNRSVKGAPARPGVRFISSYREPPTPNEVVAGGASCATKGGACCPIIDGLTAAARFVKRRIVSSRLVTRPPEWWPIRVRAFTRWVLAQCRDRSYACVIGSDPNGLVAAARLARAVRAPLGYHSLELYTWRTCRGAAEYMRKAAEYRFLRRTAFTIIQDADRAGVLAEENRLKNHRFLFMPVAGLGSSVVEKSRFLHERFGIPAGRKILLHAGGIFPWNRCLEIAEAAGRLPDDWVTVIHGFPHDREYAAAIRRAAPAERFILSLEKLPFDLMNEVMASADIGMLLYQDLDPNFHHIANSSNRLVYYLRHGLPIIAADLPGLKRLIDETGCGQALGADDSIENLVHTIDADYPCFSAAARRCYEERYDARKFFPPILEALRDDAVDNASC